MGSLKENATAGALGILLIIMNILGVLIHLFTVLMANEVDGFIMAAVTLVTPVVAELFWFVRVWIIRGEFLNPYTMGILAYVSVYILIAIILNKAEKNT
jgi:hypothetical protein